MPTILDELDPLTGLPPLPGQPRPRNPYQSGTYTGPPATAAPGGYTGPPVGGGHQVGRSGGGTSGRQVTIPGYNPDYAGLIANDPNMAQLTADLSAQGIADDAARNAAFQRAFVQFGSDLGPEAFAGLGLDQGLLGSIFDAPTRQLAAQNTQAGLSIAGRLEKARKDNVRAIRNALAARGALRSGELGHQLGEEQQRYSQAQYDSRQQLLDYLRGVQQARADAERERQRQRAGAIQQTADRYANDPRYQPTPAQTITTGDHESALDGSTEELLRMLSKQASGAQVGQHLIRR